MYNLNNYVIKDLTDLEYVVRNVKLFKPLYDDLLNTEEKRAEFLGMMKNENWAPSKLQNKLSTWNEPKLCMINGEFDLDEICIENDHILDRLDEIKKCCKGKKLTDMTIDAIELFISLYDCTGGEIPEECFKILKDIIKEDRHIEFTDETEIKLDKDETLLFYKGTVQKECNMELVKFYNIADCAITIDLKETVLERILKPGESIYAIRKGGAYVKFLPRCMRYENVSMKLTKKGISINNTDCEMNNPVSWSYDKIHGIMYVTKEGTLQCKGSKPEVDKTKKYIAISNYLKKYLLLDREGYVHGNTQIPFKKEKLIDVFVGKNNIIAIDSNRKAMLSIGGDLPYSSVVKANVIDDNWMILLSDGTVVTNYDEYSDTQVYDIGMSARGYYILTKEHEILYKRFGCNDWEKLGESKEEQAREISVSYDYAQNKECITVY